MGRGYAKTAELEEGDRHAQARATNIDFFDETSGAEPWASRPTSRRRPRVATTRSATSRRSRKDDAREEARSSTRRAPAAATTTAASPVALPRRWPQAALPHHRLQARQDRRARQGRVDRVRSEPHGAHRAPPLRRRREALHPRARRPEGRRQDRRRAATPTSSPATALPLRYIPLGTMIHNIEMKKGKGGAARALRRRRGAAHGQGRRLRAGPSALAAKSA